MKERSFIFMNRKQLLYVLIGFVSVILVLSLPFVFFSTNDSIQGVRHFSYWGMLTLCLLFVWFFRTELKYRPVSMMVLRREWMGVLIALMCSLWTLVHSKMEYRILLDEYVLNSTALNLHFGAKATHSVFTRGPNGVSIHLKSTVDKRPAFFPFILSIVHGVVGYSPDNVFFLNFVLTYAMFLILHCFVSSIAGRRWGVFSQLSLVGLPLLGLSSTSAGYEIMNLCWILVLIMSGLYFLRSGGWRGLDLMIVSSLILANCRYESILYTVIPVVLVVVKVFDTRSIHLTPFASISPLLLLFPLMSNRVFYSSDRFFQTDRDSFFGMNHYLVNIKAAGVYLFDVTGKFSNSPFLSVLGVLGILLLLWGLIFRRIREVDGGRVKVQWILVLIMAIVLANTIMALSVFWGSWTDPITSRFSLPLHMLMVLIFPLSWYLVFGKTVLPKWSVVLPLFYILGWGSCVSGREMVRPRLYAVFGYNRILKEWPPEWNKDDTFVFSKGSIGTSLFGCYGEFAEDDEDRMRSLVESVRSNGVFDKIVFADYYWNNPFKGKGTKGQFGSFTDSLILDVKDSWRYDFDYEFRVCDYLGMKMPVPNAKPESCENCVTVDK